MPFSKLGLAPALLQALSLQNFEKAYPIQEAVIPAVLNGKDVLGIAKTGSGKTASYVLPILTQLDTPSRHKNRHIRTLVMVPTRELAIQVREVFQLFSSQLAAPPKTMAVYGGVALNPQMKAMMGVSVLIATPGRLLELVDSNAVHLSDVETLVLDEADKMLNLGFREEMSRVFDLLPNKRQNLLFSATLSKDVDAVTALVLNEPLVFKVEEKEENVESIRQFAYFVSAEKKGPLLRHLIQSEKKKQVLVFTSSTHKADMVTEKLCKNGIDAMAMHSKKSQDYRLRALRNFKQGSIRVLVATDLIARGIDIVDLPCVVNYELPRSPKDYIHRIGRTGRAEALGEAISLVSPDEEHHFKIIQKKMGKQVTILVASDF
jgi:ATP-dependent RNA helicase RhlE